MADHCPADAYAGRCPGIHPTKFAAFRCAQRIAWYQAMPHDRWPKVLRDLTYDDSLRSGIMDMMDKATRALAATRPADGMSADVRDLRGYGMIDELPEAALSTGLAYISEIQEMGSDRLPTGNRKVVLGGHTTPDDVEAFMVNANAGKFGKPVSPAYGNPVRGYAGVVIEPEANNRSGAR